MEQNIFEKCPNKECRKRVLKNDTEIKQMIDEYNQKYPYHCKKCDGWGGFYSTYNPSLSGVSLGYGYFTDFNPCQDCYDKGICPRCGEKVFSNEDLENGDVICSKCGWIG